MRITQLTLENFKRFTHLEIRDIPPTAKLVLLIGANGSGKSSVFDAFEWMSRAAKRVAELGDSAYYSKKEGQLAQGEILFEDGQKILKKGRDYPAGRELGVRFYGRSSNRIVPRISGTGDLSAIEKDSDGPGLYIDSDNRFSNDVFKYISDINQALREPVFAGKNADTVQIFRQFVEPLNRSLAKVLGEDSRIAIQIYRFEETSLGQPSKLLFKKGEAIINYDLLSHGEKQVVTLLLNFLVRNRYHQDTIYFIDEMDVHLNTALQYALLQEITTNWIPEGCQLWTASHSLGFIRFAHESPDAAVIDFDELDFDLPQTLVPLPDSHPDVYDIAVGKDFLPSLLAHHDLFFVENRDKDYYAALNLPGLLFISENNRNSVFYKTRSTPFKGIVDRDFLTDDDIREIIAHYPTLFILDFYSIENYFYHPDNLATYHQAQGRDFDRAAYIQDLLAAKNTVKNHIIPTLALKRTEYPYFKEPQFNESPLQRRFTNKAENEAQSAHLGEMLSSDRFEDFYPVLPMKTYCTQLAQRQHIPKSDLARTSWFSEKIRLLLAARS